MTEHSVPEKSSQRDLFYFGKCDTSPICIVCREVQKIQVRWHFLPGSGQGSGGGGWAARRAWDTGVSSRGVDTTQQSSRPSPLAPSCTFSPFPPLPQSYFLQKGSSVSESQWSMTSGSISSQKCHLTEVLSGPNVTWELSATWVPFIW